MERLKRIASSLHLADIDSRSACSILIPVVEEGDHSVNSVCSLFGALYFDDGEMSLERRICWLNEAGSLRFKTVKSDVEVIGKAVFLHVIRGIGNRIGVNAPCQLILERHGR